MISLRSAFGLSPSRVGVSRWRRFVARFDWPLFLTIVVLGVIGLLNLYSATYRTPHSAKFDTQLIWIGIGFTMFLIVAQIDYHVWHRLAWVGLGAAIVAIIVVRFVSDGDNGAHRWIEITKWFRFQPSEIAKIAVILALARALQDRATEQRWVDLVPPVVGLIVPIALIAVQPDLGTSVLVALIVLSVCLLTVKNLIPIATAIAGAVALLPILWDHMHDYQKSRVLAFLDPAADPTGTGWHSQQSIFAVGSGKLAGKGFLQATQNHFNFLPEYWTDFPFSVWAEEWGFVGSLVVLAIYAFLVLWIVNIALRARDSFGTAICLGVAAMVFWQAVVNMSMVLGLAPVVGVTLPLISYGGSSMVTIFIGLGLVASVSARRS